MIGLGGGGAEGVAGADGMGGSGVSAMTSVPPGVFLAASSSLSFLSNSANLLRQASRCLEPLPRHALQPGVSPNLIILSTVM